MRTLIYDESLSGHHLEYLHHYYMGACNRPDEEYVICVPQNVFEAKKDKFHWPEASNISFKWIDDCDRAILEKSKGATLKYGRANSKLIVKYARMCNAERVLLTKFISTIPSLLMLMPHGIKVRGIVYRIYLYRKRNSLRSRIRFAVEDFSYRLMAHSKVLEKVFILNDQKTSDELNEKFNCSKFTFLPDPVPVVDCSKLVNLRQQYSIPDENKIFFHFGGLTKRKGTLEILRAIIMSKDDDLNDKTFVFAGRIYNDMHDEFYSLLESAKQKAQILIFDEFCEYDFLYNMCYTCDVILMPYMLTELSSGVLGYAAVFKKPVIGPSSGLIGQLIAKYEMGLALDVIDSSSLVNAFNTPISIEDRGYSNQNSIHEFIRIILK